MKNYTHFKNETFDGLYEASIKEVGLEKSDITILGSTNEWLKYDLPKKYQRKTNDVISFHHD